MVEQNYSGKAKDYKGAEKAMYANAQNEGAGKVAGDVLYTVSVEARVMIAGEPNKDYNTALASALSKAGVKDVKDAGMLEVTATAPFEVKAEPSGAGPMERSSSTLTDLF